MVMSVCERALVLRHDAEDAFQTVFLILARKAVKLKKKESVGSWLHGAALRVVLQAKKSVAVRRKHERRAAERARANAEDAWQYLRLILDEELECLPEKYRAPLVLCYLEGNSNPEAARRLGLGDSALGMRLARGRELLR